MTQKLKALIVGDEAVFCNNLSSTITNYFPEILLLEPVKDVESASSLMQLLKPDVVFLDIEMKNGSSWKIVENLSKEYNFILMSSVDKYCLRAIALGVMGYLLKPIKLTELMHAVNKVKEKELAHLPSIEEGREGIDSFEMLALPSMGKIELINKNEISYLKADGRYTLFYMVNGASKMACKNLGEFEKLLNPVMFFRIHHSYIVNVTQIKIVNRTSGNCIELRDGTLSIPVAKRKLELFNKYLKV